MSPAGTLAPRPTVPLGPRPRPATGAGARVAGGLLLGTLGTLLTAVTWLLLVVDDRGRRLDDRILARVEDAFMWARGESLGALDLVGLGSVGLALAVIAGVGLARRRPGAAAAAVVLVLGSQAITQGLKLVLPREGGEGSLPSGHVTVVTALVVAALIVLPVAGRALVAVLGTAVVVGASAAVVIAGWHRPGDVLAAYGVIVAVGGSLLLADGFRRGLARPRG